MTLIAELKRRNVFKVGIAYMALAWVVAQITGTIVPALNLPASLVSIVVWIGLIGFPFVLVFSWVYELTPEGLKRESEIDRNQSITHVTSRRLDMAIVALLVIAIALFALDRFIPRRIAEPVPAVATNEPAATPESGPQPPAAAPAADAPAAPPPGDRTIAVLPFVDMSAAKDQEYMSDGIAEELLNTLAKIPELQVTSRSSAFSYKGKEVKLAQVARELHVAHVLEGSVRTSGNRVRITAQLIDTRSDTHLWSETYDRTLDDIFAVQDEISAAVVEQLKIKLLGSAPKATATDPKAYALFLQARQLGRQHAAEGYLQSITLYQQTLAIDPSYVAAWTGLAESYVGQGGQGLRPAAEAFPLAREAIGKALAIDPQFGPAHGVLGTIAMAYDGDLAAAARHFEQALAYDPANPDIIRGASSLAGFLGRPDAAIALAEYCVARDPVNPSDHTRLGHEYAYAGRFDEALAHYRSAQSLGPGRIGLGSAIGNVLLLQGDADAALAAVEQEIDQAWRLMGLSMVQYTRGQQAASDTALATLISTSEKDSAYNIAYVLAWRNEADRAFEWLDKAVGYHDTGLPEIVVSPLFATIRNDPRWLPFLRRIGKAPEQLAAVSFEVKLPAAAP